jgi:hypothetical protein
MKKGKKRLARGAETRATELLLSLAHHGIAFEIEAVLNVARLHNQKRSGHEKPGARRW